MKVTKDSFGNTRIYPFAEPDAEEKDYFLTGYIEVFTCHFLKGDEHYGQIRPTSGTGFMTPEMWAKLNAAMNRAFDVQREFLATESETVAQT